MLILLLLCSSVKSIKYICKYVNKGSDMAMFQIRNTDANAARVNYNDAIMLYQIGRYISSNKAYLVSQFMNGTQQL